MKKKRTKIVKNKTSQLCPECGMVISSQENLKKHVETRHYGEKQICSVCNKEVLSIISLKKHIKAVHEKIPCELCGQLNAKQSMLRHFQSKHISNDQKKFKCDVCGKGFITRQYLNDHAHIHTGEKPYKCKYCEMCFASVGTHRMHERTHLGHRRKYSKKKISVEN